MGKLGDKELEVSMMVLYQTWLARNEAREEEVIANPMQIVSKSLFLLNEWHESKPSPNASAGKVVERWTPPDEGWYKANVDGASSMDRGHGGCGVVLRDHHGGFIQGASHFLNSVTDAERAELHACKEALKLALEKGSRKISLESDCMGAVSKLRGAVKDRSVHGPLVEDIKSLLRSFEDYSVRHVRRSGNGVAHLLAKYGCENKISRVWVNPPDWIVSTLAVECA
jgi:ribonuclease HI